MAPSSPVTLPPSSTATSSVPTPAPSPLATSFASSWSNLGDRRLTISPTTLTPGSHSGPTLTAIDSCVHLTQEVFKREYANKEEGGLGLDVGLSFAIPKAQINLNEIGEYSRRGGWEYTDEERCDEEYRWDRYPSECRCGDEVFDGGGGADSVSTWC